MPADSYKPPQGVRSAAARGLALREKWKRGGLSSSEASDEGVGSGVQRAVNLKNGDSISLDTIKRMSSFFARHEKNYQPDKKEKDGGPTAGTIAWLLWGGSAGKSWVEGILNSMEKRHAEFVKVDKKLGLVMGFAIVSKIDGEDYFDVQGDHIPEEAMLEAATDFMKGDRTVGDMHLEEEGGTVVFAWPLTTEIAKAFDIKTKKTGLMIAIKPKKKETLEKFENGEYTGFSIGGKRIEDEEID